MEPFRVKTFKGLPVLHGQNGVRVWCGKRLWKFKKTQVGKIN